jgi:serine/threonine-protein kinase
VDTGPRLGSYDLRGELGRGGSGVVYRAYDRRLHREVALKVLQGAADERALEEFKREARAAAKLRHPGIVVIYGAEVVEGARVVALELVEGGSLAQRLKRGALASREAAKLVADLAAAVQAAHAQGIVHRDLKPANVLLEKDGRPRLTDFGLARDEDVAGRSRTGDVMGTPAYMAPEQARGDVKGIGPWTDVWGLGAVLFEALSGAKPFAGTTAAEVLRRVVDETEVPSLSRMRSKARLEPLPTDLVTICQKALEKDRRRRYPTAAALEDDLRRWLDGREVLAKPASKLELARRAFGRNFRSIAVGLGVAVAATPLFFLVPAILSGSERREHYRQVLASVGSGPSRLPKDTAVYELTKDADPGAVPLLVAQLDASTPKLLAATRAKLLSVQEPRDAEERGRQPKLVHLVEALDAVDRVGPDERIERKRIHALEEARRRLGARANAQAASLLASEQAASLGEDLPRVAVAVDALGRLRRPEAAAALGRFLHAVESDELAIAAVHALGRIGDARAVRFVLRDGQRVERGGALGVKMLGTLKAELNSSVPTFEARTAIDYLDQARLSLEILDDRTRALDALGRALALDPEEIDALQVRADIFIMKRDWAPAIKDYEKILALDPDSPEIRADYGFTLARAGEPDRGLAECDRAVAEAPRNARVWASRGDLRDTRHDDAAALADLGHAIELDPGYAAPWAVRASVKSRMGDHRGAVEDYSHALELEPTSAAMWNNRGAARLKVKDLAGALSDFAHALGLSPRDTSILVNRSRILLGSHDTRQAIADCDKALAIDPACAKALAIRANARREENDVNGGRADLDRAVGLEPGEPEVWGAVGDFEFGLGRYREALDAFDRQVMLDTTSVTALAHRALAKLAAPINDVTGALEDLSRAIEKEKEDGSLYCLLGMAYLTKKDYVQAEEAYTKSVTLTPGFARAWAERAQCRLQSGNLEGALADSTRAIEVDGSYSWAHAMLAIVRRAQGDRDAAIRELKIAIQLAKPGVDNVDALRQVLVELESGSQ